MKIRNAILSLWRGKEIVRTEENAKVVSKSQIVLNRLYKQRYESRDPFAEPGVNTKPVQVKINNQGEEWVEYLYVRESGLNSGFTWTSSSKDFLNLYELK